MERVEVYAVGIVRSRHSYFVFIPGVSVPTYSKEKLEELNAKEKETFSYKGKDYNVYEATQYQRQIENEIRKLKRENLINKETGLEDDFKATKSRINMLRKEYKEFSSASGIRAKLERTQI